MRADCMRLVQLRTKMLFMGRQIICSVIHGAARHGGAERGMDHLYQHCTLHKGTQGRRGLLTVGLSTTGQFSRGCSRPEIKTTVASNHSRVFCCTPDVVG